MRKAMLAKENLIALHFATCTSLLGDQCLDLRYVIKIWNEDGKGWVSRIFSYLESLNTFATIVPRSLMIRR
jgi:hypothetical protein